MKGFKAFDSDLRCRGFQFEVGKTYEHSGEIAVCGSGFHFCECLENVYGYYDKSADTRICEIEATGEVLTEGDKSCTSQIHIIRELTGKELIDALLKGNNSGHRNSGDCNSGDCNSGHRNSGDCNSGNRNSGYYNSGHRNSGYFNSNIPYVRLFNRNSKLRWDDERVLQLDQILTKVKPMLRWITSESMTDAEKGANPAHTTTGGFLRNTGCQDWSDVTQADFEFIKSLPNFDAEVFEACTGVKL